MRKIAFVLAATVLVAAPAQASPVHVMATGTVIFNGIGTAPLGNVNGGETAIMSFMVDTANFVENLPGDVRAYEIDAPTFSLSFSGGVSVGLVGAAPPTYFCLVEGFPVSDGFFVSSSTVSPGGVPLEHEPFQFNLDLGYVGETLTSLDIEMAKGIYMFDGLTRFAMDIWQVFPDNVLMAMDFASLSITNQPLAVEETSFSRIKGMYR